MNWPDKARNREAMTGNKRDKEIYELRQNSRKWRVIYGSEKIRWPFFILKQTEQYDRIYD